MNQLIYAAIIFIALFMTTLGSPYGLAILLVVLGVHALMIFAVMLLQFVLGMEIEVIGDDIYETLLNIGVQSFIAIGIYTIWNLGYEFYSGMLSFPLLVAFVTNISKLFRNEEDEQ